MSDPQTNLTPGQIHQRWGVANLVLPICKRKLGLKASYLLGASLGIVACGLLILGCFLVDFSCLANTNTGSLWERWGRVKDEPTSWDDTVPIYDDDDDDDDDMYCNDHFCWGHCGKFFSFFFCQVFWSWVDHFGGFLDEMKPWVKVHIPWRFWQVIIPGRFWSLAKVPNALEALCLVSAWALLRTIALCQSCVLAWLSVW